MSKYGKRPRMTCPGCGKDVAKNVKLEWPRFHKCPHGLDCFGDNNAGRPCEKCSAEIGDRNPPPPKTPVHKARAGGKPAANARSARVKIDTSRPIASLRETLGLTAYAVGKALGGATSACDSAERSGVSVQVSTLVRLADALGFVVEIYIVRRKADSAPHGAQEESE